MSALEIAKLCDALPPDNREEVADFARFLLSRQENERWETIIDNPVTRPALESFLRESAAEDNEVLNLRRL